MTYTCTPYRCNRAHAMPSFRFKADSEYEALYIASRKVQGFIRLNSSWDKSRALWYVFGYSIENGDFINLQIKEIYK